MSITILPLGYLKCQYFRIINGYDENIMYRSPVSALLIQHPVLGNILYDTGNSPYHRWEYGDDIAHIYPVEHFISIEESLRCKGLSCADIDLIILSHLHFDHAGGLKYFQHTKAIQNVIVAECELWNACRSVFTKEKHSAYIKSLFDLEDIVYHPIHNTVELSPELTLFVQNAHTPGVIGLIIKTKSMGNIITTSDTVYTKETWEKLLPPGGPINKGTDDFLRNIERLKHLQQQYNATMLFGHDETQIIEWSKKGTLV